MRGRFKIQIMKRKFTTSKLHKDQSDYVDKFSFYNVIWNGVKYFKCISERRGMQSVLITRDELAFIRLIYKYFGAGDYCIKTWAKGVSKRGEHYTGYRVFWDGVISNDGKFLRRRNTGYMTLNNSYLEKESYALNSEQKVSSFMKTKRPGVWHVL